MRPKLVIPLFIGLAVAFLAVNVINKVHRPPPPEPVQIQKFLLPDDDPPSMAEELPERAEPATRGREAPKPEKRKAPELKVSHAPERPKTGDSVLITADFRDRPQARGDLALEYQVVEPGQYIALGDRRFEKDWVRLSMNDQGQNGDTAAGDGVFSATLADSVQKHRRLVRYRFRSLGEGKVVAPDETDRQPNYAYFVYDGVPAWKGAIDPRSRNASLRRAVTYSPAALESVPVYHFISSRQAVENVTWKEQQGYGGGQRNEYRYTGTMVVDGVVYDHIGFRARGGGWRHAMGKNMWKFNFLPGHRLEARDHYGTRYNAKWDKLNLGACIQQGDYGMRGEQGMFEAVGFRLFNLAGVEAPRTHWVHLRIIDDAKENPSDQYDGDFWGLYLAVENLDDHFLKEHDLPKGNLYKMEHGAKTAFNGNPAVTDQSDVRRFMRDLSRRPQTEAWWRQTVDLPRYYGYRAILECIHHYDIDSGKNYFYYLNPASGRWSVVPWDIDLSWGDHMFGGGHEPFYRAGALSNPTLRREYQERLAELRDLLFNPEQIGRLIDEHAAMISDPGGKPSLVDADRAKWDFHPVMSSRYVMGSKAGQGLFYFGDSRNDFRTMVESMKDYAAKRAKWIDTRLLNGYRPPAAPEIGALAHSGPAWSAPRFRVQSSEPSTAGQYRWRLAEVKHPGTLGFDPRQPWKYEIQALWEENGGDSVEIPANLLEAGRTYRVRARWQEAGGAWSRWSDAVEFTAPDR